MGTISPHIYDNKIVKKKIEEKILKPLLKSLKESKKSFTGFIFLGLRVKDSEPYLLEINTRFGDSKAEAVFRKIEDDKMLIKLENLYEGKAENFTFLDKTSISIALVQGSVHSYVGWPYGDYPLGKKNSILS